MHTFLYVYVATLHGKSVATFNTPKIITHVFVLMNFVSFLHIKAFITQIARKFPLSRMLRHVRLQWSFTFKSPITPIAREWNALVFWSNMIHVIFFLVISLFYIQHNKSWSGPCELAYVSSTDSWQQTCCKWDTVPSQPQYSRRRLHAIARDHSLVAHAPASKKWSLCS